MADVAGAMAEVSAPVRRVLLISAGASHSVALLCELSCIPYLFLFSTFCYWVVCFVPKLMDPQLGIFLLSY